jgi:glutaredoxin 3
MNSIISVPGDSLPDNRPVLYTKVGCPWCAEARAVLDRQGILYAERSLANPAASAEMLRLSGQTKAPVLDWSGEILADFGALELEAFLAAQATGAFTAGGES